MAVKKKCVGKKCPEPRSKLTKAKPEGNPFSVFPHQAYNIRRKRYFSEPEAIFRQRKINDVSKFNIPSLNLLPINLQLAYQEIGEYSPPISPDAEYKFHPFPPQLPFSSDKYEVEDEVGGVINNNSETALKANIKKFQGKRQKGEGSSVGATKLKTEFFTKDSMETKE